MNAFDQAMDSRRMSFYDFDEACEHGKNLAGCSTILSIAEPVVANRSGGNWNSYPLSETP